MNSFFIYKIEGFNPREKGIREVVIQDERVLYSAWIESLIAQIYAVYRRLFHDVASGKGVYIYVVCTFVHDKYLQLTSFLAIYQIY